MTDFFTTATAAAQAAASIHRFHALDADKQIDTKANYADIVTKVDKECEEVIRRIISDAHPDHAILGEEAGQEGDAAASHRWVVDPLDGTINYASGFPFSCVSIALAIDGRPEGGVVRAQVPEGLYDAMTGHSAS